ncbi:hypothetical protein [Absidia glauca]|uniref:Velvet domain-containing protein n=1 Tax=Absidia glauca TaxID=4829 RepID=A0A168RA68_ABSGL|nr:hypothetical protein [Absidia glauca]
MSRGSISYNYDYISASSSKPRYQGSRLLLTLRQQPVQARFSTSNERDRKPIEPPPIIQIQLKNATSQETQDFLQSPYFFMSVNLASPSSNEEIIRPDNKVLSGQTVSSMYKLKDVTDKDGGFFCFGDLSSRIEGEYRLKFTLFEIVRFQFLNSPFSFTFFTFIFDSNGAINLMHTFSDVFKVYNSKSMPRSLDATFLSRSFSDQGVRIRIRKEHRVQVATSKKRKLSEDGSLVKSPSQVQKRDLPIPLLPTRPLSPTAPTSPTSTLNSHASTPQQQHLRGRFNYKGEEENCNHPAPSRYTHHDFGPTYQQHSFPTENNDSMYQWRPFSDHSHSIPYSPPPQPYDFHSRQNSLPQHSLYDQQHHQIIAQQQQAQQQQAQQQQQYYPHHSSNPHYQQYPSPTAMLSPPSAQLKLEQRRQSAEEKVISPLSPLSSISSTAPLNLQPTAPVSHFKHKAHPTSTDMDSDWAYNQPSSLEPYHSAMSTYSGQPHPQQQQLTAIRSPSPPSNAIRLPPLHTMVPSNENNMDNESNDCRIDGKNNVGEVNAAVAMMQLSGSQRMGPHKSPKKDSLLPGSLSIHTQCNRQFRPAQQQQHHYQDRKCNQQHNQYPYSNLDPSRRASTGVLYKNLY